MHSEPPRTRPLFLPAVTLPHNTSPHQTTQNNPRIQGLHVTGLSFCLQLHDHTTQHSTTQNNPYSLNTFRAFKYKARLSACSYTTTQHNSKQLTLLNAFRASTYKVCLSALSYTTTQCNSKQLNSFECILGLCIQGLSFCLKLHYQQLHYTTQLTL